MRINFTTQRINNYYPKFLPKANNSFRYIQPYTDTVSFKHDKNLLNESEGKIYAEKYKHATAGYRGELGADFNDKFVYTMTQAVSKYMHDHNYKETIVGGDTRTATKIYAPQIIDILQNNGINVKYPQLDSSKNEISPIASPVLSVITALNKIPISILLTASHNPWKDGGYNFIKQNGMVIDNTISEEIAKNISQITKEGNYKSDSLLKGKKTTLNPYEIYKNYIETKGLIDFENIRKSPLEIYYEDFGGTGKYYYPKLMEDHGIKLKAVLSTKTKGPNPTAENMKNLGELVKKSKNPLRIGLATDGDSDRFGVVDENGNFIDANDVLVLCAYHLIKNKGMKEGSIVINHSTSSKVNAIAQYFNEKGYNIYVDETPVGFKYLGREIERFKDTPKEIILAGEGSSGGLTIRGHVPEKDGFVAISILADLVATENKPIGEILSDINCLVQGSFNNENINIKFPSESVMSKAVENFAPYAIGLKDKLFGFEIDKEKTKKHKEHIESFKPEGDGYKIYFKNSSSILIRKSGTEPVMRYCIDTSDPICHKLLKNYLVKYALKLGGEII